MIILKNQYQVKVIIKGGGRKKGNIIAKLEQLNGLIFKSIIQRRRHKRRKRRKNVETKHKEQMKMLSGLTNILGNLADAKK